MSETRQRVRYWVAEPDGIALLAARLGLDRLAAAGLAVEAVEVVGEDVRLQARWPGVGDAWVRLNREDGRPRFCGTGRIGVVLEGASPVTRPWAVLMKRVAASVGDASIDEVTGWLAGKVRSAMADDPDWSPIAGWSGAEASEPGERITSAPGPDGEPGGIRSGEPPSPGCGVDRAPVLDFPRPLREFFCDHAMQRKFYESFRFEGRTSYVTHGDIECSFITPRARARIPRFFNYPWPLQGEPENWPATTDLGDLDVINGGTDRLEEVVRREIADVGGDGPVTINSTCVPTIIGDDVDGLVARHAPACSAHGIWHLSPRTAEPVDIFMRYLEPVKDRFREEGRPVRPGSVALVGFREEPARDDIVTALRAAGVDVAGFILPAAGVRQMAEVLEAEVIVLRPSGLHQPLYDRLFAGVEGRRRILPPAPWGWEASAAWLVAVAGAVGRADAARSVVSVRLAAAGDRLAALRARAAAHVLAFVLDPDQGDRVTDAHSQTGLPAVGVVREAGFRVHVLVYSGDAARFRDARDRIASALGDGVEVTGFANAAELEARLAPASAVFSEFFFDHRLTRAGKGQVSARDFEIGFEGAVRTAERLVRVAELPFYRVHGGRLGPGSAAWWAAESAGGASGSSGGAAGGAQ
ncbi:MAG: hypothetical protein FJ087_07590 [Deltaproteobacteria bacterium]|nr:hypothetical protein [Deltaproteobacteria bacterium]